MELQEEEDLNLAIALSQSEAEHKEKEKKRATSSVLKSNTSTINRTTYSPPPSPVSFFRKQKFCYKIILILTF